MGRMASVCVYLVVAAGGVEGVGATGEQRLVVSRDQHFDVVVALVLKHEPTAFQQHLTELGSVSTLTAALHTARKQQENTMKRRKRKTYTVLPSNGALADVFGSPCQLLEDRKRTNGHAAKHGLNTVKLPLPQDWSAGCRLRCPCHLVLFHR